MGFGRSKKNINQKVKKMHIKTGLPKIDRHVKMREQEPIECEEPPIERGPKVRRTPKDYGEFGNRRYSNKQYDIDQAKADAKPPIKTGLPKIDNHVKMEEGELIVIASPTSHGKTTFMTQMMAHSLREGVACSYITYESLKMHVATKLLKNMSPTEYDSFVHAGNLRLPDRIDIERLGEYVEYFSSNTPGPKVLFLDRFQIIDTDSKKDWHQLAKEKAAKLQRIAVTKNIAVVVGSQVSADGETIEEKDLYNSASSTVFRS